MNDELNKNELEPEELIALDRLLTRTAGQDDAQVDYAAMLEGVKARAAKEGIVIFPSAKANRKKERRRSLIRSTVAGFAVAAAVLIVGFAAVKGADLLFGQNDPKNVTADVSGDESSKHDTIVRTKAPVATEQSAYYSESAPEVTDAVMTPVPAATEIPDMTEDPAMTSMPTEYPMKGGVVGYVLLDSFDAVPDEIDELIPEDLPAFMEAKGIDEPFLEAKAYGIVDEKEFTYVCRMTDNIDSELSVGVARYSMNTDTNTIHYLWRISEENYLDIEFVGFERFFAENMLLSLVPAELSEAA